MPFDKFDPHGPASRRARTEGERKAKLLRWWSGITLAMTVLGFAFIGYWLLT